MFLHIRGSVTTHVLICQDPNSSFRNVGFTIFRRRGRRKAGEGGGEREKRGVASGWNSSRYAKCYSLLLPDIKEWPGLVYIPWKSGNLRRKCPLELRVVAGNSAFVAGFFHSGQNSGRNTGCCCCCRPLLFTNSVYFWKPHYDNWIIRDWREEKRNEWNKTRLKMLFKIIVEAPQHFWQLLTGLFFFFFILFYNCFCFIFWRGVIMFFFLSFWVFLPFFLHFSILFIIIIFFGLGVGLEFWAGMRWLADRKKVGGNQCFKKIASWEFGVPRLEGLAFLCAGEIEWIDANESNEGFVGWAFFDGLFTIDRFPHCDLTFPVVKINVKIKRRFSLFFFFFLCPALIKMGADGEENSVWPQIFDKKKERKKKERKEKKRRKRRRRRIDGNVCYRLINVWHRFIQVALVFLVSTIRKKRPPKNALLSLCFHCVAFQLFSNENKI